jgi:copper resistance protein C
VIRDRLSLAKAGLSRAPAGVGPIGKDRAAVPGPFSEGIAMNGFVKSGLTLALTLCGCGTAYAHANLLHSAPAAGTVVTAAPGVLRLDFSEGLQLGFTGVSLRGPGGAIVSTGHARLALNDDKELLVPLPQVLTKGQYTVGWHALSDDGHTTRGSYGFRVAN